MNLVKDYFKSLLLVELLKGMALTLRTLLQAEVHRALSRPRRRRSRPASVACMRCAAIRTAKSAASPASCARRSARRWRSPSTRSVREDGSRRTTRYDIDLTKCIFCGFCEEAARSIRSSRPICTNTTARSAGDLYFTKDMLLASATAGSEIAKRKALDAAYR
jgi:NADH-quinone oxidoreductase subunit I